MVGFVIREVELEEVQLVVDGIDKTDLTSQSVQETDAAATQSAAAVGDLIVDVRGRELGSVATVAVAFVEAAFESLLAAAQLLAYLGFHLKSLWVRVASFGRQP